MKILVTGVAGFIGMQLTRHLLRQGHDVVGIDGLCLGYYDIEIKYQRLTELGIEATEIGYDYVSHSLKYPNSFRFIKLNLEDNIAIENLFRHEDFDLVINLAGFANVRYSIDHPEPYVKSNILGFLRILQACRINHTKHLIFASTSTVQGLNEQIPTSVTQSTDHPTNMYSTSKKMNELMSHTYSHLFGLPVSGMRFYTVYGPWGRPDMAIFKFTKAILEGVPIDVYGHGQMSRDFTYIDDILQGIDCLITNPPVSNPEWDGKNPESGISSAPYQIYNIGSNKSCSLMDFIAEIEKATGMIAKFNYLPMQPGDLENTWAEIEPIRKLGYEPDFDIKEGVKRFVKWYREYYKI
jgi:UDP-glucuronate 4-epimerase